MCSTQTCTQTRESEEEKCRKKEMSIIRMFSVCVYFFSLSHRVSSLLVFIQVLAQWCWSSTFHSCTKTSVFLVMHYLRVGLCLLAPKNPRYERTNEKNNTPRKQEVKSSMKWNKILMANNGDKFWNWRPIFER